MPRYIDYDTVKKHLDTKTLIAGLKDAFIALSKGEVTQPLRSVMTLPPPKGYTEEGVLFQKPSFWGDYIAVKLVTLIEPNADKGLPTHLGSIILLDSQTGQLLAVMDGTWITELRTAATAAVATDALTTPGPKVVAILGTGALARTHAITMRAVREVSDLRIWGRTPEHARACAVETKGRACKSAEEAVVGADIICTVTSSPTPVLKGAWLKEGAHVNAMGGGKPQWRELDDEVMKGLIIADKREAVEKESGDVVGSGAKVFCEIGEVLMGKVKVPQGQRTVFKSPGQAVADLVPARLIYEALQRRGPSYQTGR